ncbi:uroporphyrinogen-III synthase, partial [Arthrobacter sp. GCM10027362]|uniref:uroporphyrinogen-III synthase n=1 Tax=Arthrobacter sp. GCM10027362 TaxID=3273379 RepID=UPI00362D9A8E
EASMDAVGLVAAWPLRAGTDPAPAGPVLLPQADIAAATIEEGLAAKGWQVRAVTAYHTVDYPARPERRLTAVLAPASGTGRAAAEPGEISVADFTRAAADGGIGAVVLTSPSVVRRLHAVAPALPAGVLLVAIGNSTAREAAELGLDIAAVAAVPTPAGIADALATALCRPANQHTGEQPEPNRGPS